MAAARSAASMPAARRPQVLVVDDDDDMRTILVEILERAGFSTVEAADGDEALALVDRELPDAVLLDQSIPKVDGAGVAEQLKSHEGTRRVPVVMLSGFSPAALGDRAASVDAFVEKSGAADTFVSALRSVLVGG